ncbi:MAG: NADH-quinone oxidoreductase subunit N [Armatimonadetes bacterium]|nr:NADH-quinone oxidoreductase subunit N [Armatimonadota bacterium]
MTIPGLKDMAAIAPQLLLGGFAMLVLLLDAFWPRAPRRLLGALSLVGLVAASVPAILELRTKPEPNLVMQGMLQADGFTAFVTLVLVIGAALAILLSMRYLDREGLAEGEYYALLLLATLGGIVMAGSVNLICLFLGLEILSIALYILAGYRTQQGGGEEAALKYFLLGAFASAIFLYGVALVYGATGSVSIEEISQHLGDSPALGAEPGKNRLLLAGVGLLLVGFCFKVAVVPFHVWTPDVYEGAPTSVTAFMSVCAKTAGFAAFVRVMGTGFEDRVLQGHISAVLTSIAALTMLLGNVVAVVQPGLKRLLAYSSIAHAGYMLTGVVAAVRPDWRFGIGGNSQADAMGAVLFYALAYTFGNLGAFGVIMALRRRGEEVREVTDLTGLGQREPLLAAAMTLFLLSLAGLPPTAGFFGKLFLINSLLGTNPPLPWLVILFALTSVVSFYYYLGVVRAMYMDRPEEEAADVPRVDADWNVRIALAVAAIGCVVLGLWAGGAYGLAGRVAGALFDSGFPTALR